MAILKLGSINAVDGGVKIGSIMLGGNAIGASVTVATDAAKSINLNNVSGKNYGSLNIDKDGNLSLRVSSPLDDNDKEIKLAQDNTGGIVPFNKLTSVNFTSTKGVQTTLDAATLKILKSATFGSGKDSVSVTGTLGEEFVLNTGAGKDVISLSASSADENAKIIAGAGDDIVIVESGDYKNVALGAGKDTVQFTGDNAAVKLTDYKYNEDVIISSEGQATLTNDGTLKLGSNGTSVVSGIAASNNLYLAKVNKDANTTMYATAAEDSAKVDVNASSIEDKNVVINTTSADSANITTGKATLTSVSLNSSDDVVNTIKIGDASAKNSVKVNGFNGDDVLNFTGLSFAKTTIGLDNNSDATLTNGKVSLNLGAEVTVTADNSSGNGKAVKFNLNGKTLYATTANDQVINLTEEEDITKVLVTGQNVLTGANYSGIKTSAQLVDLGSSNFHNINMVVLTEDTAAKASVIGTKNTKTGVSINASDAADGVAVWANNSSTSQTDKIIFGDNDVADTLWLGSNDGHDVVSGFDFESDVLYLADANSMKVEGGVIKVGKSKMTVTDPRNASEIMQVQGAKFAGTYYVAGDFQSGDNKVVLGENAGQANYYAVGKKAVVEINSEMTDTYTFLKDIDYAGASKANIAAGGSVASINAGTTSEDAKVIVEGVANVTVGAGTNEVWVNGAAATGNVELNGGSDKVWFGASDKIVKVSNYDADSDVIALLGNTMDYKAKKDANGDVVITAGTSKLKVATASEFLNVVDSTGAAYKVYAGTATDTANYTTNTESRNIFVGIGTLTNDGTIDENTTLVVNGANNQWGLQSAAVVDKSVKTIDMSGSSADFTLVGSSTVNNTITGGTGTNYLNGGGASKDTLNGVTGAVDNFYYGKGDGEDTLVGVEADDIVQLYNVSAADIATIKADDPSNVVITMNDKSKLTINGLTDGATFVLTDGVYTYDSTAEGSKFTKL